MTTTTAIIGCGNISRFHLSGLERAKAQVRWACDLDPAAAARAAARCGATATGDWRQAVDDPAVRLVVVTTITAAHREICLAAIARGKAVVCEKTLAENAAEAWEITAAAQAAGTPFWTNYMKRHLPCVEQARELLPAIGQLISTHARTWQLWGDLWTAHPADGFCHTPRGGTSLVKRNMGGAALHCCGSHIVDLVLHLVGRPWRVFADEHIPPGRDYDLRLSALMQTRERGCVMFEACAHAMPHLGISRDGWDERIEINGVHGRLTICTPTWDQSDRIGSLLIHEDARTRTRTEHRFAPVSPFDIAVGRYVAWAAAGEQGGQAVTTGYEADELIGCLQRSARSGAPVEPAWRC